MARDALTVTTMPANAELEPIAELTGVAANGIKITPANTDDILLIEVENTGAGDLDVTFITGGGIGGISLEDVVVTVTAGERRYFRMTLLSLIWIQSDGDIYIDVEADTDLDFWAYKL